MKVAVCSLPKDSPAALCSDQLEYLEEQKDLAQERHCLVAQFGSA